MDLKAFKAELETLVFDRDHTITSGYEMIVYVDPQGRFVIKVPKEQIRWGCNVKESNLEAITSLGGLIPRTSLRDKFVLINNGNKEIAYCGAVVQEKGYELAARLEELSHIKTEESREEAKDLMRQVFELEREMMSRGRYNSDNYLHNYIVLQCAGYKYGKVLLCDLGSTTPDLDKILPQFEDLGYKPTMSKGREHRLNKRGWNLYVRIAGLKKGICDEASDYYKDLTGLEFEERVVSQISNLDITEADFREVGSDVVAVFQKIVSPWSLLEMGWHGIADKVVYIHELFKGKDWRYNVALYHELVRTVNNLVPRTKFAQQFIQVAKRELELYFKPDGVPVPAEPYFTK